MVPPPDIQRSVPPTEPTRINPPPVLATALRPIRSNWTRPDVVSNSTEPAMSYASADPSRVINTTRSIAFGTTKLRDESASSSMARDTSRTVQPARTYTRTDVRLATGASSGSGGLWRSQYWPAAPSFPRIVTAPPEITFRRDPGERLRFPVTGADCGGLGGGGGGAGLRCAQHSVAT